MNTYFRRNDARKSGRNEASRQTEGTGRSLIRHRRAAGVAVGVAVLISATACGGQSAASLSGPKSTGSAYATPTPTPTPTAPASSACTTENATEKYPPNVFICTKSDAGSLLWMEQSASKKVSDARAAAAAVAVKAAADKAAADKAAQEAAAKAAQEQAAAETARQQAAAAAAAAAAAKVEAPVRPAAPVAPSGCDPNYAGACVPIASDVDCAGGSGNGPAYVRGPVTVVGSDIYRLDSDGDGIGCE
jgi:chemotaxis protein histidine kinase CheA